MAANRNYFTSLVLAFSALILLSGCDGGDLPNSNNCNQSDLAIQLVTKNNPTSCSATDGSITVTATGGNSPYTFSISGGTFSSNAIFNGLGAGTFTMEVKDKSGCKASVDVQLVSGDNSLTATKIITADTDCLGDNGAVQINASGGRAPYQYKLNSGSFGTSSLFNSLAPGTYEVIVKDADNCTFNLDVVIPKGDSETKLSTQIKPIIESKCAVNGCHNGSQSPDLRSINNIISSASRIKATTQSGSMPRGGITLLSSEKALIACWVDEGAKNN